MMKILRFGKAGTVHREVDHMTLKIVCVFEIYHFLKSAHLFGNISSEGRLKKQTLLGLKDEARFGFLVSYWFGTSPETSGSQSSESTVTESLARARGVRDSF